MTGILQTDATGIIETDANGIIQTDGGGTAAPSVSTVGSSNLGPNSVDLTGDLTDLGSALSVDVNFQYREDGATIWQETSTQSKTATGQYSQTVSGLNTGTVYEFRAQAVGEETDTGEIQGFTLGFSAS